MPWLEKGNVKVSNNLLFIHVPRCGGTSLMKSHDVPYKAAQGATWFRRLGMKIFFHRYQLLETTNFPIFTGGNAICIACFSVSAYLRFAVAIDPLFMFLTAFSMAFFFFLLIGLSFVFVAPTIARIAVIRRSYLILVQYVLCRFMENIEYITGTNIHGYLPHLTAHKMLNYGYVTPKEMDTVSSMAIVRNPYSRMVSIYMYNRFGPAESFSHFVRSWYHNMRQYREMGEMEEWFTACHLLPQFEFTHFQGTQLVQSIVKQEELKYLKTKDGVAMAAKQVDSSVSDLPTVVRDSLLGMPHTNRRTTKQPWYELYDQQTLNLTYEMYQHDFAVFNYPVMLKQRPDLHSPVPMVDKPPSPKLEKMQRDTSVSSSSRSDIGAEMRSSLRMQSALVTSRRSSMNIMQPNLSVSESSALLRNNGK